jgi:ABC-2 type transport system permease protein
MSGPPAPRAFLAAARAAWRHDWRRYVAAPLTYVFLGVFSLSLAVAVFLVADFMNSDVASLRLMLVFLPWVAIVLVPALAMTAWVEDTGDRSLELTLSLPLPTGAVVLGKFLAGLSVLLVALACTAAFPLTVAYLGEPDPGAMAAGYVAAAGFLAVCLALALMAAALTRERVSAFLLGVVLLFALTLLGWDVAARAAGEALPPWLAQAAVSLSPKHWLDRTAAGHLTPAAAAYLAATVAGALTVTALLLRARRRGTSGSRLGVAAAAAVLLAAGAAAVGQAERLPGGLDLTAEGEFSLDPETAAILEGLPGEVEVTLWWSKDEASVPAPIKAHARRVERRLRLMARRSGGRLAVRTVDPEPDSEAELDALEAGVARIPMTSGDVFYLGATARRAGRATRIAYLDPRRDRLLDYDLALMLSKLAEARTPRLGILSPLVAPSALETGRPGLGVIEELQRAYDVAVIPHFADALPQDLDALLVIDATILKPSMVYSIDQHVMRGGGLVLLMDPHLRSHLPANQVTPRPTEEVNDVSDLLLRWGVRYLGEAAVGDAEAAAPVRDRDERQIAYPFWLRLPAERLSAAHAVTADLDELLLAEPGAFEIAPASPAEPIARTGPEAGARPRADFSRLDPGLLAAEFAPEGGARTLAVALGARLPSAFEGPPDGAPRGAHLARAEADAAVFAVADADWIFDAFAVQQVMAGEGLLQRPLNDNHALLLNMLEYASGGSDLIAIRSRGRLHRPFTRIEAMLREGEARHREKEAALAARIAEVEAALAGIPAAAGVESADRLPAPLQERIEALRRDLLPLRRELRDIRRAMREDVERLGQRLTALNLAAGPALVLAFAGGVTLLRRRWQRR